jgi:hypothetical protein
VVHYWDNDAGTTAIDAVVAVRRSGETRIGSGSSSNLSMSYTNGVANIKSTLNGGYTGTEIVLEAASVTILLK